MWRVLGGMCPGRAGKPLPFHIPDLLYVFICILGKYSHGKPAKTSSVNCKPVQPKEGSKELMYSCLWWPSLCKPFTVKLLALRSSMEGVLGYSLPP